MTFITFLSKTKEYFCNVKLFTTAILSLLLLSNSLKNPIVYGWYALDIDSFIEQLCENKDTPELQCNGKCYLSKMSASSSKTDEQKSLDFEWNQLVFCQTEIEVEKQNNFSFSKHDNFQYINLFSEDYSSSIFHPPQV